jgi:hypothetical protein
MLRHLSYALTTTDFRDRGLDRARFESSCDHQEHKRVSVVTFSQFLMECSVLLTVAGCTNDYLLVYQTSEPHFVRNNPACHAFLVYLFLIYVYLLYRAERNRIVL